MTASMKASALLVPFPPCLQIRRSFWNCRIPPWGFRILRNHPEGDGHQTIELHQVGIVDFVPVVLRSMVIGEHKPRTQRVRDDSFLRQRQIVTARKECVAESWMAVHLHASELARLYKHLS